MDSHSLRHPAGPAAIIATLALGFAARLRSCKRVPTICTEDAWEEALQKTLEMGRGQVALIWPSGAHVHSFLKDSMAKFAREPKFTSLRFSEIPAWDPATLGRGDDAHTTSTSSLRKSVGYLLGAASSFAGSMIDPRSSVRFHNVSRTPASHGNKPVVIVVHEDQVMGTIVAPESEEMLYSFLLRHAKLVQASPRAKYKALFQSGAKRRAPRQPRRGG